MSFSELHVLFLEKLWGPKTRAFKHGGLLDRARHPAFHEGSFTPFTVRAFRAMGCLQRGLGVFPGLFARNYDNGDQCFRYDDGRV